MNKAWKALPGRFSALVSAILNDSPLPISKVGTPIPLRKDSGVLNWGPEPKWPAGTACATAVKVENVESTGGSCIR